MEVLKAAEPGLEGGDFRQKLRKARDTKINTAAAFPEAKANPEQVDFRNILKKTSSGTERKDTKGGSIEEQPDFKGNLKKSKVCICLCPHTNTLHITCPLISITYYVIPDI